ncbi:hypothetical protein WA026_016891 [Henosepilachna vigintioctopunctata]|uniref:Tectonic-1 n=1 Tax=Henosepilachna vigintioctopunctata TaxID=420089 RepID=A0AAW1U906_9CUCU
MWFVILVLLQTVLGNVTLDITDVTYPDYNFSVTTLFSTSETYGSTEYESDIDCNSTSCSNKSVTQVSLLTTSVPPKLLKATERDFGGSLCLCNLHVNACDVNCCCDDDCSYEMKSVFDHCESIESENIDRRSCSYVEHNYVNFTLQEWDIQSNDLFCVVKSNVPPSRTLQKDELLESYEESLLKKDDRYDWPQRTFEVEVNVNYSIPYVQGSLIWIILNNSTTESFKLCEALISSGCDIQTEAKFLHDFQTECVHAVKKDNKFLNIEYYNNFIFVAKPNLFNYTKLQNRLMTCPEQICLKTDVKICSDINLRNCTHKHQTDLSLICAQKLEEIICKNVVKSFKYVFHHEGIKGLKNITLLIHLTSVTHKSDEDYELEQSISVEFLWANSPTTFSNILGGNPGYLIKKPILIGTLINGSISRNPESFIDNFMVLPDEDHGECSIGKYSYQVIEFGYNIILMCKIRGDVTIPVRTNATDVCRKIQLEIFKYWSIEEFQGKFLNRSFGYFGNANSSISEEWKEIMYDKLPEQILNRTKGTYRNKNKTLICTGLALGLNINIYHARVDLKKLVDQEKILGITYEFQVVRNGNITFSFNHPIFRYEFMLDTRVKFWDVTSSKRKQLLDPPSLNIKLPSDFSILLLK